MNNPRFSNFYFICKKNGGPLREILLEEFKKTDSDARWLFASENFCGLPADIGYRHKNGDGIFLRIFKKDSNLCFETDELSGVPVFWMESEQCTIIASSMQLLARLAKELGLKLEINGLCASEYMVSGYVYSKGRTLLNNVFLQSPKSLLKADLRTGACEKIELAQPPRYNEKRLSELSAPQKLRQALEDGCEEYRGKKIALLLSGGGSSRILASCAVSKKLDVDFFTFGQSTVNDSDFSIANNVAHKWRKKTHCFRNSGEDFLRYWKKRAGRCNWMNDSIWWAGMIPEELFEQVKDYDVLIRGDGDGFYGWGGERVDVSDILHGFEIPYAAAVQPFSKYFADPEKDLFPFRMTREKIIEEYSQYKGSTLELKGILYRLVRECPANAPGAWYFSSIMPIDAPFLWSNCVDIAYSLPEKRLATRWVIFEALQLDEKVRNIPYSSGSSWDNSLDFYFSGVSEELINYVEKWLPFECDMSKLKKDYLKPPPVPAATASLADYFADSSKRFARTTPWLRSLAIKFFPHLAHTSMSQRFLVRLAMISNLNELIHA